MQALPINAGLRPVRCIKRAAGKEVQAMPKTDSDSGKVASKGSGAIRLPAIPPKATSMMVPQAEKACAKVKIQMLRIIVIKGKLAPTIIIAVYPFAPPPVCYA